MAVATCPNCGETIKMEKWSVCPHCHHVIHIKIKKRKGSYQRKKVVIHPPNFNFKSA